MTAALPPDQAARVAATDLAHSVIVQAPAGSGKTSLLTLRFVKALATVESPEEVVAITFTVAAVNELRVRVQKALAGRIEGDGPMQVALREAVELVRRRDAEKGWGLAQNLSRLRILTIDGLNSFLARQAPVTSGFGGAAAIAERPYALYREAILQLASEIEGTTLDDESREDLELVFSLADNRVEKLIELLGGKSGALAKRDQWLQAALLDGEGLQGQAVEIISAIEQDYVSEALAVGRTPLRAMADAGAAVGKWGFTGADINQSAALELRAIADLLLLKSEGAFRQKLTASNGFAPKLATTVAANEALADLQRCDGLAETLHALRGVPTADSVESSGRMRLAVMRTLVRALAHLTVVFQRSGQVDFVEVALRAQAALVGAGGDEPLAERMDYQIRHILVDECQDTSAIQFSLVEGLIEGWTDGDGRTLFMVGDPQQSIYAWRQAEVRLFMGVWRNKRLGSVPMRPLQLTANFRSAPEIVSAVNSVCGGSFPRRSDLAAGEVQYVPSEPTRDPGGRFELVRLAEKDAESEADHMVQAIRRIPAGETIAVLARGRSAVKPVIAALRSVGIDYSCVEIDALGDTAHVRAVVALVRALWHPADAAAWATLLRSPVIGCSWQDLQAVFEPDGLPLQGQAPDDALEAALTDRRLSAPATQQAGRLLALIRAVRIRDDIRSSLADRAEAIWRELGGAALLLDSELEDVERCFDLVRKHSRAGGLEDLAAFQRELDELYAAPGVGRVQIMTIHKSKGLEFDHVFLPGMWRKQPNDDRSVLEMRHVQGGILIAGKERRKGDSPLYEYIHDLNSAAAKAEDLRVLYVALTRAKRRLTIYATTNAEAPSKLAGSQSLLRFIWPTLHTSDAVSSASEQYVAAGRTEPAEAPEEVAAPLVPAIGQRAADLQGMLKPLAATGYKAHKRSVFKPSEAVLRSTVDVEKDADGPMARAVGTLYHELMDRLYRTQGWSQFEELTSKLAVSMAAGMSRRGLPLAQIPEATERVFDLIRNTLRSPDGQWMIQPRSISGSETRLAGFRGGKWVSAMSDLWFVEDQIAHVIDYKTGSVPETAAEAFLAAQVDRYRDQVRGYQPIIEEQLKVGSKGYLFFPGVRGGTLIEI